MPRLDEIVGKFISRKLVVFLIATIFIYLGKLESQQWVEIAMVYVGSQAAVDLIGQFKK